VRLLRSDSLLPPASQAFALAADSVVIATGQTYSPFFDITGNTLGSANLVARATGYSQATAVVSVGQPRLQTSTPTITLYVGERPPNVTVSTLDQSGQTRIVATPLVIAGTASDTAVARPDSATRTVAARQATTSVALRPRRKGSVDVVYTAAGYTPDTTVVTVDTAKLDLQNPPNGLGPGQVATTTMYVQVPYTTDSALVVSLSSTNPGACSPSAQATIPAGSYYAYFSVTGTGGRGLGDRHRAALVSRPWRCGSRGRGSPSRSRRRQRGQRYTFTIAARDSLNTSGCWRRADGHAGVEHPGRTQFDSLTTTIAAGQSSVTMGVSFDTAGTYVVTASAAGYDRGRHHGRHRRARPDGEREPVRAADGDHPGRPGDHLAQRRRRHPHHDGGWGEPAVEQRQPHTGADVSADVQHGGDLHVPLHHPRGDDRDDRGAVEARMRNAKR
jgi:hypothetical protein